MPLSGKRVPRSPQPFAHRVFEAHASRHPERVALTCGELAWSYRELNTRANRFAHYLISEGVGQGSLIGVCLDRSANMIVAVLGILKAGAAYVPLDATYPDARLQVMISQLSAMRLVVASESTAGICGDRQTLDLDRLEQRLEAFSAANPRPGITGESICYVVFTSGSTGTPKAVGVRHEGWYNLLNWLALKFGLDSSSSNLFISAFGFDISQRSLMTPLFTGAALHLLPSRHFDALMSRRLIRELDVRTLHLAPTALYALLEGADPGGADSLAPLAFVFVGGEALVASRIAAWAENSRCRIVNVYGVAECTDVATAHVLTDYSEYLRSGIPIGEPIYNVDVHVLTPELGPASPGEVGELGISGLGVGAGYVNDSWRNRECFVTLYAAEGPVALYRTGDLVRAGQDGVLSYIGRADSQVKVRGMRIETGEVEAALEAIESVRQAVVSAIRSDPGPDIELVAFVMLGETTAGEPAHHSFVASQVRRELLKRLPGQMIPRRFIVLPEFPLGPNGKIDRAALARLGENGAAGNGQMATKGMSGQEG
jgi:D-alanine--poly(phosphoribitol) ligase subunit 1